MRTDRRRKVEPPAEQVAGKRQVRFHARQETAGRKEAAVAEFRFDHIHIFCSDINQTVRFYEENFGAQFHGIHDYGDGKLAAHLDLSGVEMLISNADADHKPGLHHIGFRTTDLEKAAADLRQGGCNVPDEFIEVNPRFKLVHIDAMPKCVDIELQNGTIHDIPLSG